MQVRFSSGVAGKPRFPQGSWGGSAASVDFERHVRASARAPFPPPVNY